MESSNILLVVYIVVILMGVLNLFGVLIPVVQAPAMAKYTADSVKAWCRPYGLITIIMGIGMACIDAYRSRGIDHPALLVAGIVSVAVAIVGSFVLMKKLVRKPEGL